MLIENKIKIYDVYILHLRFIIPHTNSVGEKINIAKYLPGLSVIFIINININLLYLYCNIIYGEKKDS
jgi:hypothetical protein